MVLGDLFGFIFETLRGHKLRATLTVMGIVIGIAAVVLLSSIGEGTRQGIAAEFSQFGTTLISVIPGKTETMGVPGSLVGTTRRLTIEDGEALRRVRGVRDVAYNVAGVGRVEHEARGRDIYIFGVIHRNQYVWKWGARVGSFIPDGDPHGIPAVCALGPRVAKELFPGVNPLGQLVRVEGARFRVVGIMESKGNFLGLDLDDAIYVPLVRAMRLFNQFELHEINVEVASYDEIDGVVERVREVMIQRHGEEDVTIISQKGMLDVIGNVMDIITQGVVAIAAIAILVGAMGILTITWVSVHERTAEIGLMKAIGASNAQVMSLFLAEAIMLSTLGGVVGVGFGIGVAELLDFYIAALRVNLAPGIVPVCMGVSVAVGALSGYLPARRAARLDPVTALRDE